MDRFFAILLALGLAGGVWAVEEPAEGPCDRSYVGVAGGLLLPGNGNSLHRAASVAARAGWYWTEALALEAEVASVPHAASGEGGTPVMAFSARALFHLSGWETFDKLFGCERFDPFVTTGVQSSFASRHVFADGSHRTGIGPMVGVGTFYHLSDAWSLRFDAMAALDVDSPCGMRYGVALGLQRSFGDGE